MQSEKKIPLRVVIITNLIAGIAAASAVVFTYVGIFPFDTELGLYRILPGDILVDFIWIWILAGSIGLILYLLSPYLANLFLVVHKILTGGAYDYHFQVLENGSETKQTRKLILPAFVSLGLTYTMINISQDFSSIFVFEGFNSLPEGVREPLLASMPLFFILLLLASVVTFVFAPAWLLEDTGLICVKKGGSGTAYVEGVGNWYLAFLKGFAGITTILAYLFTSLDMISWFQMLPTYTVEVPILIFLIPVTVVIFSPLIALAPISISYSLYVRGYSRNSEKLMRVIEKRDIDSVSVEILKVNSK